MAGIARVRAGLDAPADAVLGGLTGEEWDRLAGPNFYSSAAWLRLCASDGSAEQGAAVIQAAGQPVAAVPLAEISSPPLIPFYRWNDVLAGHDLPVLAPHGLLVGPRLGFQTNLLVGPGTGRAAAAAALVEEVRRWQPAGGSGRPGSCVAMYLTTEDVRALRAAGVAAPPVLLEADAWIELPAGGWPAWVESFHSKRRITIAREARRFAEAGYRVVHKPLSECYQKLAPLAAATVAKYGHGNNPDFHLAVLRRHAEQMGPAARVALCLRDDDDHDPVGFCLYFLWGDTLFLRWAGFDYERLAGAAEYFNLVYYEQIRRASGLGARRLHAGMRACEAKALRGAELRPLWLMDLTADSVHTQHCEAVRRHNRRAYDELAADSRTRAALSDPDAWHTFC